MVSILSRKLRRRLKPGYLTGKQAETAFHQWMQSPLGSRLFKEQSDCLKLTMKSKFGKHLIQLDSGAYQLLDPKPPVGWITLVAAAENRAPCPVILASDEYLPFLPDSIDHMALHHRLDFSDDPYQVLRQCHLTLCPGGYLILIGFNPWSLWGLRKLFSPFSKSMPWVGRFLSAGRVEDWLNLLGLEVEEHYSLGHYLPINSAKAMARTRWFEKLWQVLLPDMGGSYVLVARKQEPGVTRLGASWQKMPKQRKIQRANIRNEG